MALKGRTDIAINGAVPMGVKGPEVHCLECGIPAVHFSSDRGVLILNKRRG